MMKYSELRRKILSLLSQPPYRYNIPYLARLFHVDRTTIHKVIKPLERKGIIVREKIDGMTWISLHHKTLYESLKWKVEFATRKKQSRVDLINNKRVSQTQTSINMKLGKGSNKINHGLPNRYVKSSKQLSQRGCVEPGGPVHNKIRFPKRAHPYRIQAWKLLLRRKQLTLDDWVILNELFNDYLEDTGYRTIILFDEFEGRTLWIGYKHRFTKSGIKRVLRKFSAVFSKANKYRYGVFITLTLDPKKYRNMIEARYELQNAWNRMMSYFKKKLGKRPAFIRVIEFTKKHATGLIHYHVLLLGIRRLLPRDHYEARLPKPVKINNRYTRVVWASTKEELEKRLKSLGISIDEVKIIYHEESLTEMLEKWGFGKISDVKLVINRNGRWMTYKYAKLLDSNYDGGGIKEIKNLKNYLKKYLIKAFNDLDTESMQIEVDQPVPLTLYWALNTRFFTYSKQLRPEPDIKTSIKIVIGDREYSYKFLGSGYIVDPSILPCETDDPPWSYHIPLTFPPLYDPGLSI